MVRQVLLSVLARPAFLVLLKLLARALARVPVLVAYCRSECYAGPGALRSAIRAVQVSQQ